MSQDEQQNELKQEKEQKQKLVDKIIYIIILLFGFFSVIIGINEFNNISKCLSDLPEIQDEQSNDVSQVNQCLQKNLKKNLTAVQTTINLSFGLIILSIIFLGVCIIQHNNLLNKIAQISIIILLILNTVYSKLTDSSNMNSVFIISLILAILLSIIFVINNFLNKNQKKDLYKGSQKFKFKNLNFRKRTKIYPTNSSEQTAETNQNGNN